MRSGAELEMSALYVIYSISNKMVNMVFKEKPSVMTIARFAERSMPSPGTHSVKQNNNEPQCLFLYSRGRKLQQLPSNHCRCLQK